jgi:hypothetical protein
MSNICSFKPHHSNLETTKNTKYHGGVDDVPFVNLRDLCG